MSDTNARVLRPGHRIALDQQVYTVIQLSGTTVTLQDQHGKLSAMLLGYLLTAPGFTALDAAPPKRAPQDGRLSTLDEAEQRRIRWLEGHLIEIETGRHPEGPVREAYDPDLHTLDERELAKVTELRAEGAEISQRSLQRLRQAYRDNGLVGLADKRALRSQTPGAAADSRVVEAIEQLLADPRGRSTVARSVMFTELQRKLDEVHGPGEVPLPSRATFYRLMSHMDRGRRNFVSEASRRVSVNRPDRPFTPVTALRPGEDVPIDTNKLDIMCRYADGVVRIWDQRLRQAEEELQAQKKLAARPGHPVVLDTSVLMEGEPFLTFGWHTLAPALAGEPVRLIVPILVIEELDDLLHDWNGDRRQKARAATRELWQLHGTRPTDSAPLPGQADVTIEVLLDGDWHQRRPSNDAEIIDQWRSMS